MRLRHSGRLRVAFALVATLSACTLSPNTPEPKLDIPENFRATSETARAAWPPADWWQSFGSAELDDLMVEARSANFDIAAAAARVQQADAQVRIAGAALLPTVSFAGNATRSQSPSNGGRSGTIVSSGTVVTSGSGGGHGSGGAVTNTFNFSHNASYEIDFWGKNRAAVEAAQQSAIASRFDQETVALSTVASVANTYFNVLAAQDRLRIAHENLDTAERILAVLRGRLEVGTTTALDVAQQESLVATQRAAIPPLEQTLRQNVNALAILVALPPERIVVHGGDITAIHIPQIAPGLPSELLTRRPDVQNAEAQLEAANANVQVARAAFFPTITLTGQGGFTSTALDSLFDPASGFWSLASGLTQPIFEGGSLEGQLDLQRGR